MAAPIHSGQIIVVTGASKGIGAEISRMLGKLGAKVVMLARDIEALNIIAAEINQSQSGGAGFAFQIDLKKINEMAETVNKIIEKVGVPDVLINNAGAGNWTTILETSLEDIIQNIEVPGLSTMIITKHFLDKMIKKGTAKSPVHIINMTSPAGLGLYVPGTSGGYSVARYMVANFTELLRIDLRPYEDKVKISLIAPGKVSTGYFVTNGKGEQEDRVPMRWIPEITPKEVAKKVSKTILNRQSVTVIFPFALKVIFMAFKISPTIMQLFLTHVFGWQPSKKKVSSSSSKHIFKIVSTITAISLASLFACLIKRRVFSKN